MTARIISSTTMLLLSILLCSVSSTIAFMSTEGVIATAKNNNRPTKWTSALRYKDVEDNDFSLDSIEITRTSSSSIESTLKVSTEDLPNLPRSYVKKMTDLGEFPSDSMSEVEMLLGRICMVASVWLIGNEIFTGVDLPDQIMAAIGKL